MPEPSSCFFFGFGVSSAPGSAAEPIGRFCPSMSRDGYDFGSPALIARAFFFRWKSKVLGETKALGAMRSCRPRVRPARQDVVVDRDPATAASPGRHMRRDVRDERNAAADRFRRSRRSAPCRSSCTERRCSSKPRRAHRRAGANRSPSHSRRGSYSRSVRWWVILLFRNASTE